MSVGQPECHFLQKSFRELEMKNYNYSYLISMKQYFKTIFCFKVLRKYFNT